jgi:MFS family permease
MTSTSQMADTERQVRTHGWWPLLIIASAQLMAILDTTVMFVALPSAQHAVGLSAADRQWIVTAYTLAFAALLLVGGRLADRLGARRTLLAGVIGFALASAAGGAAVSGAMLLTARAAQGASAALVVSSTKSLLVTVYTGDEERSRAIAIFTAANAAGGAIGLVLGGMLTTTLGWRWCLYVNVVVSLIAIIGGPRVLPAVAGRREIRIDLTGAVLASAGMAALVYGLGEAASAGWGSGRVAGSLAGAAVAVAAFVTRQVGKPEGLLPLRVVCDRNRGGALLAMIVNNLSTFGMMLILTYQFQTVMGYSALRTGFALLPFAIGAAVSAALIAPASASGSPPAGLSGRASSEVPPASLRLLALHQPVATCHSSSPPPSSKASAPASAARQCSRPAYAPCFPATPAQHPRPVAQQTSSAHRSARRCSTPSPPPRPPSTFHPTAERPLSRPRTTAMPPQWPGAPASSSSPRSPPLPLSTPKPRLYGGKGRVCV